MTDRNEPPDPLNPEISISPEDLPDSEPEPRPQSPDAQPQAGGTVFRAFLHYLNSGLLTALAGFISFPIISRILEKHEYGTRGYFDIIALMWVAVLKLGTQNSIVRLYPAYCKTPEAEKRFLSTLIGVPALASSCVCILGIILAYTIGSAVHYKDLWYFIIVLFLGQIAVLISLSSNLMRAREQAGRFSIIQIIYRYLDLIFILVIVLNFSPTAMGIYAGRIITSVLVIIYLIHWTLQQGDFSPRNFDPRLFRESLSFGIPLVFSELSMILLAFGDRLFINPMLGADQLGIYMIGYDLASYVGLFMRESLMNAFQPVANRIFERDGHDAARQFEGRVMRLMFYASSVVFVGILLVGGDLLQIISGSENHTSIPTFVWIGCLSVITPLLSIATYGLTLLRRSRAISAMVMGSAVLNMLLNWILIPHFGLMGSVYATVISYLAGGLLQIPFVPRDLWPAVRIMHFLRPIALAGLLGAVAWGTGLFGLTNHFARLSVMGLLTLVLFVAPALAWDRELRLQVLEKLNPLLNRFKRA